MSEFTYKSKYIGNEMNLDLHEEIFVSPAKEALRTVAIMVIAKNGYFGIGTAVQSPDDNWDYGTGIGIARARAVEDLVNTSDKTEWFTAFNADTRVSLLQEAVKEAQDEVRAKKIDWIARQAANFAKKINKIGVKYGFEKQLIGVRQNDLTPVNRWSYGG